MTEVVTHYLYTDGCGIGGPVVRRIAGWAFVLTERDTTKLYSVGDRLCSSSGIVGEWHTAMAGELTAIHEGLRRARQAIDIRVATVVLRTDYLQAGNAVRGNWKYPGYRTLAAAIRNAAANLDLTIEILPSRGKHGHWPHSLCHSLASKAAKAGLAELSKGVTAWSSDL